MKQSDWLLAFLYAPGDTGKFNEEVDELKLMKQMFILGDEIKASNYYSFIPSDSGPFSVELYKNIKKLKAEGLVVKNLSKEKKCATIMLSSQGESVAKKILEKLEENKKKKIVEIKKKFNNSSYHSLLTYIYARHPEFAEVLSHSILQL